MATIPPIMARARHELGPDQIDRRQPAGWEPAHLDPEGVMAALEVARQIERGRADGVKGCSPESMAVLAVTAYVETARETARRGAFFPTRGGLRIEGVHPEDVQAALAVVNDRGGLVAGGGRGEETIARAISAALASQEARTRRGRAQHRHVGLAMAEMAAEVAHRVAIHRAGKHP